MTANDGVGAAAVPSELMIVYDNVPLLPGETCQDVRSLRALLAADHRPATSLEHAVLIRTSDLMRLQGYYEGLKKKLLEDSRRQVVEQCLKDMPPAENGGSNPLWRLEGAKATALG